jgi:hypothetical protein
VTGAVGRYATSTKHIVGCTAAIAGPALSLAGVLSVERGLLLVPVLYAMGVLVVPQARRDKAADVIDPRAVQRSLARVERRIAGRVPYDIWAKTSRIASAINETLPRADALGPGAAGHYALVACATDYLPTTLQAYLDLPRSYADHHVVTNGKTSRVLVVEQLDVLAAAIKEIAEAVNRADTDRLIVNGRFLATKFGREALDVENPARQA